MIFIADSREGFPKGARTIIWLIMISAFTCAVFFGHSAYSVAASTPLSQVYSSANPAAAAAIEKASDERMSHFILLIEIAGINFAIAVGLLVAVYFDERRRRRIGKRGFPIAPLHRRVTALD